MALKLMDIDCIIPYREGKLNGNANGLSRLAWPEKERQRAQQTKKVPVVVPDEDETALALISAKRDVQEDEKKKKESRKGRSFQDIAYIQNNK